MKNNKELQRLGAYTQALVEIKDWCEDVNSKYSQFVEKEGIETYTDSKKAFLTDRIKQNLDFVLSDLTSIGELYD